MQVFLKNDHASQPTRIQPVGKTRSVTGLAISSNGAWLVATAGHKVHIAKTSSLSTGFTKYVSPERLTCLAFHPFEEYFATGDDKGNVRLWYCLNDNLAINARGVEKRTQTTSLHWHAHAVSSVTFTPNGAYLLSGGEEAVLVIWQLHTGKKEFVPRVGAQISTVSVSRSRISEEEYLLGLADSTYTFISSASLKITRSYSRIKIGTCCHDSIDDLKCSFHHRSCNTAGMDIEPQIFICPSGCSTPCFDPASTFIPSILPPNVFPHFFNIYLRIGGLAL